MFTVDELLRSFTVYLFFLFFFSCVCVCDAKGSLCKYACVCVFNYISLGSSSVVLPYSSTMIGVSFFSHRGFL